ncbi:DUF4097 family beta strand repeat-containing protein [Lentibacillus salicampi]|uniref:DUF4097 domain-containing protein n=1 Tax=Lentibacillus salicampi TaxID=175306 RepID=A0A4Y9A9D7_9BACI|nr:DUF4097 family beta strand repeat-containing protein [Lentibacillus salicampi]TFJ92085.1 hypothetical protein E4U82_14455 [Lentibacillus salicampi]
MSSIKKLSIAAFVLLLVGVIGSFFTFNINDTVPVSEEKVIDNKAITDIEISADNQGVELISSDEDKAKVELSGRRNGNIKTRMNVEVEEGILSIELVDEHQKLFNFFDFIGTSLTLSVYLPEKVYESLEIDMDNGSAHAEQLNIKHIETDLDNGLIEMKNITATTINAKGDNGKISLENVEGKINGEVNNGKIYLKTNNLDRPITLKSNNGNIKIETEKEPTNAIFDINTDNGSATVFGSSNWNTVVGNGDNRIKLTTDNGNISVEK